jgi:hypothetical protein
VGGTDEFRGAISHFPPPSFDARHACLYRARFCGPKGGPRSALPARGFTAIADRLGVGSRASIARSPQPVSDSEPSPRHCGPPAGLYGPPEGHPRLWLGKSDNSSAIRPDRLTARPHRGARLEPSGPAVTSAEQVADRGLAFRERIEIAHRCGIASALSRVHIHPIAAPRLPQRPPERELAPCRPR